MKKSGFPKNKEWDKIVDEAFTSDSVHVFSNRYEARKGGILRGITMKRREVTNNITKKNNRKLAISVAAAAAVMALVPTSVLIFRNGNMPEPATSDNMQEMTQPVTDEPQEVTQPVTDDLPDVVEPERVKVPIKFEYGWLPDDLVYNEDGPYAGKYKNSAGGGMTENFYIISPENNICDPGVGPTLDVKQERRDDREITISYRRSYFRNFTGKSNFGRVAWVKFDDQPYMPFMFFTDDIPDSDIIKICENISLVPAEGSEALRWVDFEPDTYDENVYPNGNRYDVDPQRISFYHVGDTFTNQWLNELIPENACDVTLNSAWIQDSLSGITTDGIGRPADYSEFTDENGKLLSFKRTWYSYDDPEPVMEYQNMNKYVVVLDLTYTNRSDVENDICIDPLLYSLDWEDYLVPVNWDDKWSADGVEDSVKLGHESGWFFSFDSDKKGEKNHIILQQGESAHVQLAYEIDQEDIGRLYYCAYPCGSGNKYQDFYDAPMVDLTSLRLGE